MRSERLPFAAVPHTSALWRQFLSDPSKLARFYPQPLGSPKSSSPLASLVSILEKQNSDWGASGATRTSIARLRSGAAAVVTGQQVVLFGGPLMVFLKALTAIKLAAQETAAGRDTVPIFWLASEDHDLDEIRRLRLLTKDFSLLDLAVALGAATGTQSHEALIPDSVRTTLEQAQPVLAEGVYAKVAASYRPGRSMSAAFAGLMAALFGEFGLILLDPSSPELHRLAAPVFHAAAEQAEEITSGLLTRGKELEAAGYHAQVKVTKSSTTLFMRLEGRRVPVQLNGNGFTVSGRRLTKAELLRHIADRPEDFSANALLRPVMQDYLLPTSTYIGGPAEVAYFAQSEVLYERILGRATTVRPRASATVVDPKLVRKLGQFGLTVEDVLVPLDELKYKLATQVVPSAISEAVKAFEGDSESAVKKLAAAVTGLDPTLTDSTATSLRKIRYQLRKVRMKAATAELRRRAELDQVAQKLSNALYPHKNLQEREIAGISCLSRYGEAFLRQLYDAICVDCPDHQVLYPELPEG